MSKGKMVAVALVWLCIIGACVLGYKLIYRPMADDAADDAAEQAKKDRIAATSSSSAYEHTIVLYLDGFSGYGVLRSEEFANMLRQNDILLKIVDDGAKYPPRLEALRTGAAQMAVFPLDSFVTTNAEAGYADGGPASIFMLIDETRGADAMMAYRETIPTVDALNHPETKFVVTPDSPSETLARVVMANFQLDQLSDNPFMEADGAEAVYKMYRTSQPNTRQVFVLWEPFASKMEENDNVFRILDSSRFRGYIVDGLAVSRDFLVKNPEVVETVAKCYFRALHQHQDKMVDLVLADAGKTGLVLKPEQAKTLVDGVWWKNTTENYAHFGIGSGSLQHVEDMIRNLTGILIKTGGIPNDPTDGKYNLLFYDRTLRDMHASNFHPGLRPESVRDDKVVLPSLSDGQWDKLRPIGTLEVQNLSFTRGTSRLHERSEIVLDNLIETLETFPTYYLMIQGDASLLGDMDANKALALDRAMAARSYLTQKGVSPNRLKAIAIDPTGTPSVRFVLGENPY